ncbi:MAG: hypothetical protein A2386_02365 [Elusimicrobia bacterium RIFOXYB1_FULL_48_9]|nr:MAG: hypothetical protein A2386_02365 [Elusimicrobia bacterium RIFOXYB1_FULL_48_9]
MDMVIKDVLKEELNNSKKMKTSYKRELKKLPKGSLIRKKIKGSDYYYIITRNNGKVHFSYKGKKVSDKLIEKYKNAKEYRAKYRNLLSKVKKQIKFLKGTLRGREPI